MIRVVKVNKLRTPEQRATVVYVGRPFAGWTGHRLANPFKFGNVEGSAVERYRMMILSWSERDQASILEQLWEETEHGTKPLGCWCCDWDGMTQPEPPCHAVVLAGLLNKRFGGGA